MGINEGILLLLKSSTENLIFENEDSEYFCAICKKSEAKELIKELGMYLDKKTKEIFDKALESIFLIPDILNVNGE